MSALCTYAALALMVGLQSAAAADQGLPELDEARAAWRYRREVRLPGDGLYATIPVPPELAARAAAGLADVRLVLADGSERPYVIDRLSERDVSTSWGGTLVDTRRATKIETQWTVDFNEPRTFDDVFLDVREEDFAKRLRIEASEDGRVWRILREDAGIFDRLWGERIHHTHVELVAPVAARFLRLTADDRRSPPVELRGVSVTASRWQERAVWVRSGQALLQKNAAGVSRYRLELPAGVPFEALTLAADDPAFCRRVVLYEVRELNGQRQTHVLADQRLYRLALPGEPVTCEGLRVATQAQTGGELLLEIWDLDSPPLRNVRVSVLGVEQRLVFPVVSGRLFLYYGNPRARAPLYDIESLGERLRLHLSRRPSAVATSLGDEAPNPRYQPAPPLPFVAAQGAGLAASDWKDMRPLILSEGEDLYTLTLTAGDLAGLRPDLADLRLADESAHQVPFILERDAARERLPVTFERSSASGDSGAHVSRYRLAIPAEKGQARVPLPFDSLRLTFAEAFFQRAARITMDAPWPGHGGQAQLVFSGELARGPEDKGPIEIALDGRRIADLALEIDEGDNAPLTLSAVEGVLIVPRIVFKARSGSYRLLLGNAQAGAPRYDLAGLRREVLCYSARVAKPGPLEANRAYRRGLPDYFRATPPTLLLWGVLVVAVVALLLLTRRILRAEPPPDARRGGTGRDSHPTA